MLLEFAKQLNDRQLLLDWCVAARGAASCLSSRHTD